MLTGSNTIVGAHPDPAEDRAAVAALDGKQPQPATATTRLSGDRDSGKFLLDGPGQCAGRARWHSVTYRQAYTSLTVTRQLTGLAPGVCVNRVYYESASVSRHTGRAGSSWNVQVPLRAAVPDLCLSTARS